MSMLCAAIISKKINDKNHPKTSTKKPTNILMQEK
jgi:hypothetical protein